jgi:hypothetical protein
MIRFRLLAVLLTGSFLGAGFRAWAQSDAVSDACAPPADCAPATEWGAWGMIAIGLVFFLVWLMPPRQDSEEESAAGSITMMARMQKRIDREMTGWRRFQWPVLGLFFIGLGIAYLAGWR